MRRGKYWAVIRGMTRHVEPTLPLWGGLKATISEAALIQAAERIRDE